VRIVATAIEGFLGFEKAIVALGRATIKTMIRRKGKTMTRKYKNPLTKAQWQMSVDKFDRVERAIMAGEEWDQNNFCFKSVDVCSPDTCGFCQAFVFTDNSPAAYLRLANCATCSLAKKMGGACGNKTSVFNKMVRALIVDNNTAALRRCREMQRIIKSIPYRYKRKTKDLDKRNGENCEKTTQKTVGDEQ
jgi:hypothetical protein